MAVSDAPITLIVAGNMTEGLIDKLKDNMSADVVTNEELRKRQLEEKNQDEAVPEEPDFTDDEQTDEDPLPEEPDAGTPEAESGEENQDDPEAGTVNQGDENPGSGEAQDDETKSADNADESGTDENEDGLDDPEVAHEHAKQHSTRALAYWYRNGSKAYAKRVRSWKLATETAQMSQARREALVKRLMYVRPADGGGFTDKIRLAISTIEDPTKVVALVDDEGIINADQRLAQKQITQALEKAGVEVYNNTDDLIDAVNRLQAKIAEA